jgi:multiple sugar transport system ATP-binding protein
VLRKGVLQQVDTPRGLYEYPVNLFVAGFIGSPPMNFVPAQIEGRKISIPFAEFQLPDALASDAAGNKLLIAGIRPEHFEDASLLDDETRRRGVTFEAPVDVTEWLGNEQFAYIPFEAPPEVTEKLRALARELDSEAMRTQLVVSLDAASRVKEGENAQLWFDPARVHLFDPATGENLTREPAPEAALTS